MNWLMSFGVNEFACSEISNKPNVRRLYDFWISSKFLFNYSKEPFVSVDAYLRMDFSYCRNISETSSPMQAESNSKRAPEVARSKQVRDLKVSEHFDQCHMCIKSSATASAISKGNLLISQEIDVMYRDTLLYGFAFGCADDWQRETLCQELTSRKSFEMSKRVPR
jgi:hypothetical protein